MSTETAAPAWDGVKDVRPLTLWSRVGYAWPLWVILTAFVMGAVAVPVLADVAVHDDWVYARSVETLVRQGELRILEPAAANIVLQVLWGTLFAQILGLSLGVIRLSTVVLAATGGVAVYLVCRSLGVKPAGSAFGATLVLFNPLYFVLSFTFMSDAPFTALLAWSAYFYVRAVTNDQDRIGWWTAGSLFAGSAYLIRPHGLLIPLAVVVYLLLARRLRVDMATVKLLAVVVLLPVTVAAGHLVWLKAMHGVPEGTGAFASAAVAMGVAGTVRVGTQTLFVALAYLGLFLVPLSLTVPLRWVWSLRRSWPAWLAAAAAAGVLGYGIVALFPGRRMPYAPSWLNAHGLGPAEIVISGRPPLAPPQLFTALTAIAVASALLAVFLVAARLIGSVEDKAPDGRRSCAASGLLLCLLAFQTAGAALPAMLFPYPLDRYLLPLVPLGVCLACWAVRGRWRTAVGWAAMVLVALVVTGSTRDFLALQEGIWQLANSAVEMGVPLTSLDAGASWDGYWTFEQYQTPDMPAQPITTEWWINIWGRAIDREYVVAGGAVPGYSVIKQHQIDRWVGGPPSVLYLLQRDSTDG